MRADGRRRGDHRTTGFAAGPLSRAPGSRRLRQDETGGNGGGRWSFKDDRGRTVTLGKAPETLVAFVSTAAALYDHGVECDGVFGPTEPVDGKPNPRPETWTCRN
ncbi:hypothetical protein ACIBAG_32655 [Streptomyces sp. NPDC051243]|uniref:hypothetical protein n=1 Tax=Streptomyces sp. NPDC051243 TaxID=3365646 RepID=UPI0037A31372